MQDKGGRTRREREGGTAGPRTSGRVVLVLRAGWVVSRVVRSGVIGNCGPGIVFPEAGTDRFHARHTSTWARVYGISLESARCSPLRLYAQRRSQGIAHTRCLLPSGSGRGDPKRRHACGQMRGRRTWLETQPHSGQQPRLRHVDTALTDALTELPARLAAAVPA